MKRVILLGLGLVVAACGGTDQSTLLADGGGTNPGDDGGSQPDVTVPPQDAAPTQDAVAPQDSSVVDVVTVDVPVGPPDSKIQCGTNLTCDAQTQICCHHMFSAQQYQCVASINDCAASGDVPIACSSNDNCVSQGTPSYTCCATVGGQGQGTCSNSTVAFDVSCQADCTQQDQVPVGCNKQPNTCPDPQNQTCITSQCTLPGYNICI
jgi:hypothetical protein